MNFLISSIFLLYLATSADAAVFCSSSKDPVRDLKVQADAIENHLLDGRIYRSGQDESVLNSIGKIKCGDVTGTAFFLGPCNIITNHHFLRECEKDGNQKEIQFEYGHNGKSFQSKVTPLSLLAAGNSSEVKTKESINDPDWAVFKPPQCEKDNFPTLSLCSPVDEKDKISQVKLVGLSTDRDDNQGLSVDDNCNIYIGSGSLKNFGHDCAARAKTSGAPLYKKIGDKYCVLAIHAGCYSNSDKCENGITSKFYDDFTFNFAIPIEHIKKGLPGPK